MHPFGEKHAVCSCRIFEIDAIKDLINKRACTSNDCCPGPEHYRFFKKIPFNICPWIFFCPLKQNLNCSLSASGHFIPFSILFIWWTAQVGIFVNKIGIGAKGKRGRCQGNIAFNSVCLFPGKPGCLQYYKGQKHDAACFQSCFLYRRIEPDENHDQKREEE